MEVRNPKVSGNGGYNCEINHEIYGWIPFTAHPQDIVEFGRQVYQEIHDGLHGEIGAFVANVLTKEEVESLRKAAYANEFTGSDRLFAEAQRMQLMGESDWESVRDAAIARFEEIKAEYPWPENLEANDE